MNIKISNRHNGSKGQSFVEFIFLLMIIMSLSFVLVNGFRGFIANHWEAKLKVIAEPNGSTISF